MTPYQSISTTQHICRDNIIKMNEDGSEECPFPPSWVGQGKLTLQVTTSTKKGKKQQL
jgi:hypothetical protein